MTGASSTYQADKPRAGSGAANLKARFEQLAQDQDQVSFTGDVAKTPGKNKDGELCNNR